MAWPRISSARPAWGLIARRREPAWAAQIAGIDFEVCGIAVKIAIVPDAQLFLRPGRQANEVTNVLIPKLVLGAIMWCIFGNSSDYAHSRFDRKVAVRCLPGARRRIIEPLGNHWAKPGTRLGTKLETSPQGTSSGEIAIPLLDG